MAKLAVRIDCDRRGLCSWYFLPVLIVLPCVIIGTMTLMYRELLALEKRIEKSLLDVEESKLTNRVSQQREDSAPSGVAMKVVPTAAGDDVKVVMVTSMPGKIGTFMKSKTNRNETEADNGMKEKKSKCKSVKQVVRSCTEQYLTLWHSS